MSKTGSILVFLPNWVGDVVMASPVLRTLRAGMPEARIVYVGRPGSLAVLDGCDWCDAMIADESKRPPKLRNTCKAIRQIRRERAETALLLPNSLRSAIVARLGRAKRRIGYARDGRGCLLTDQLEPKRNEAGAFVPVPTIDYYAQLLKPLELTLDHRTMELPLTPADAAQAESLLQQAGYDSAKPLVMLNPGAAFGLSKLWPVDRYAKTADALIEKHNAQIIINAAPNIAERSLARQVEEKMQHKPLLNFAQRDNSLGLVKALLKRSDLLLTNDTGARHIAAAMGTAVVTIFGSTDPVWAQIDYPRERIIRIDVPCSPCQQKICPLPSGVDRMRCLTGIGVETVLAAAEDLLASRPGGAR